MERTMRKMVRTLLFVALAFSMGAVPAFAAEVTRYFDINGAVELWNWTTSGRTIIGGSVTSTTLPSEMADPAKVRLYEADGTLSAEYENYRPDPDGYSAISTWKMDLTVDDGLVAFNLSGLGAPSSILQSWGQTLTVGDVLEPTVAPDYDNVGINWFAQTNGGTATWWCEVQADSLNKEATDPRRFMDTVALTFDDSAVQPDGSVTLWIGGYVTADLELMGAGAPYAVLEGGMRLLANADDDGDGYYAGYGVSMDCDDDSTDDPAVCATCTCETDPECAGCARCIHPDATEVTGDPYDTNCNGQQACFVATASFGTEMEGKVRVLRQFRDHHLLKHRWGRMLVDLYYTYGPAMAGVIDNHKRLKTTVRTALLPLVGAVWLVNPVQGDGGAAWEDGSGTTEPEEPASFESPGYLNNISYEPMEDATGTGSTWGQSLHVAEPSL